MACGYVWGGSAFTAPTTTRDAAAMGCPHMYPLIGSSPSSPRHPSPAVANTRLLATDVFVQGYVRERDPKGEGFKVMLAERLHCHLGVEVRCHIGFHEMEPHLRCATEGLF